MPELKEGSRFHPVERHKRPLVDSSSFDDSMIPWGPDFSKDAFSPHLKLPQHKSLLGSLYETTEEGPIYSQAQREGIITIGNNAHYEDPRIQGRVDQALNKGRAFAEKTAIIENGKSVYYDPVDGRQHESPMFRGQGYNEVHHNLFELIDQGKYPLYVAHRQPSGPFSPVDYSLFFVRKYEEPVRVVKAQFMVNDVNQFVTGVTDKTPGVMDPDGVNAFIEKWDGRYRGNKDEQEESRELLEQMRRFESHGRERWEASMRDEIARLRGLVLRQQKGLLPEEQLEQLVRDIDRVSDKNWYDRDEDNEYLEARSAYFTQLDSIAIKAQAELVEESALYIYQSQNLEDFFAIEPELLLAA